MFSRHPMALSGTTNYIGLCRPYKREGLARPKD